MAHPVDPAASTDSGNDIIVDGRRFTVSRMARPHQICALRAAARHIDEPRGQIVMACGTGKTLVGLWLTEMRMALRPTTAAVLVLFPNLMLIRQTLAAWMEHKRVSISPLVVCSDASVADSEECAGATAPEDFADIAVTTSADAIAAFLQGGGSGLQVVFATYQSAARVGDAQRRVGGARFDLAIFDEAHKTAGSGSGFFSYALSEEKLAIGQRVFMTATPRISSMAALSMDNAEAAEQGIIVPYKVLFIAVNSGALGGAELGQAVVAGMDVEGAGRPPTAREGAIIAAIAKTMVERKLTKAISFHSRNANAERFVQYAGAMFEERRRDISLERVDGKMSTEERGKKMETFGDASEPMIMANARCLQEGVDLPALDLAILVDPKYSMVDIAQLVGRVMRTSDGKTEGYVLVPIFVEGGASPQGVVARSEGQAGEEGRGEAGDGEGRRPKRQRRSSDEVETSEESDEGSSDGSEVDSEGPDDPPDAAHGRYKVAVAVLRALMQHDDQLAATLRDLRARAGREGRPLTQEEVERDFSYFGERVDISTLEEFETVSLDTLWAATGTLVELLTDMWDQRFGELQAYKERFGNCDVPVQWAENPPLGGWVNKQRWAKRKFDRREPSWLKQERIDRLDGIGFEWDPAADVWDQRFGELQAYKARFGNCNVPRGWSENSQLGGWVHQQRAEKRKLDQRKPSRITHERIGRLNGIGFEWGVAAVADLWDQRFGELQAYKERFGNCKVPPRWTANSQLGSWVMKQREAKRKFDRREPSRITQARIERLDGIGFEWDPAADVWEQSFSELQAYKARFGNCNVPRGWSENSQLGGWVHTQRAEKRKLDQRKPSQITHERIGRLNGIGFEWNPLTGGAAHRQRRHGASASRCLDAPRSPTRGGNGGGASQPATSSGTRQRPSRRAA